MPKPLSDETVAEARRLRADGYSWMGIAKRLGLGSTEGIRRRLDAAYHERRNEYQAGRQKALYRRSSFVDREKVDDSDPVGGAAVHAAHRPSDEMIEAARRRMLADRTLTAALMGDPAPGQSALDRRMGVS